jgi:tetratricopeptide (TPR) repeat protein
MEGHRSRHLLRFLVLVVGLAGLIWLMTRAIRGHGGDRLERGRRAYESERWRAAEEEARARLQARPADRDGLRLLARAAARLGRDDTAAAIYRRLGTAFMEAEDLFLLGRGLLQHGQTGPALAALGAARDANPNHAETLDALAQYWAGSGALLDALAAAERLMTVPGWEVRGAIQVARLRSELRDPAGAVAVLAEPMRRDQKLRSPETAPGAMKTLLVRCLLECGRAVEASAAIGDSQQESLDPETRWLLSRALLQQGEFHDAKTVLETAAGFGTRDSMLQEPAPLVGASRCARCHRAKFDSQQRSRHAKTLVRTAELSNVSWPSQPIIDPNNPQVAHRLVNSGAGVAAETRVDQRVFRALLQFALGSNHQGQSFLARDESGSVRELRISHYPRAPEWDRTMEHPVIPPDQAGYLGRPVAPEALRQCLHCHATNFRAAAEPAGRPEAGDKGIGCERCHGPGGNHEAAIAAGFPEPAIARPRLAMPAQVVALCASCHRAPAGTTPASAGFVRYQASGLALSRCYVESGEAFSCVTCHDPHRDAETSSEFYDAKCRDCHGASRSGAPQSGVGPARTGRACPIDPRENCIRCHMPRVRDAIPRTAFTDHQIRRRPSGSDEMAQERATPAPH